MCRGNHIHVIGAVTYCQSASMNELLSHECHDFGLLLRRHTTSNYYFRIISEHQKQILDLLLPCNFEECFSIDNNSRLLLECLLLIIQVVLNLLINLSGGRPIDNHLVHLVIQ